MFLSFSPERIAAWTAAPYATASSGLRDLHSSLSLKNSESCFWILGIRVVPPTRITSSISDLETFAKKYDVLVFIVAHPTKMYKGQDGKIEEPTMYNIKGGGEWYDASYHGLLVHRDYEAKTTKVKVLKVKFQNLGENGAEAHFTWEPRSGCFVPHEMPEWDEKMPWD